MSLPGQGTDPGGDASGAAGPDVKGVLVRWVWATAAVFFEHQVEDGHLVVHEGSFARGAGPGPVKGLTSAGSVEASRRNEW